MNKNHKIIDFLITFSLILQLLSWVLFMPMAQIQLLIFGRRIISFVHYGTIEIIILIILLSLKNLKFKNSSYNRAIVFFSVYLILIWLFNIILNNKITAYIAMFYLMSWIAPLLLLFTILQYHYDIEKILKFCLTIIFAHAILIILQRTTNSLIWPFTSYEDGTQIFYVGSGYLQSNSGGMVRCPGLAISGLEAGILLLFGIILTLFLNNIKKWLRCLLITLFSISIVFTGTRNIFVLFAYIIVMSILMRIKLSNRRKILFMVLISVIIGLLYFFFVSGMNSFNTSRNIYSDTLSIKIRLEEWSSIINQIRHSKISELLLGRMQWQQAGNSPLIDNLYFETLYCLGIGGLIFFIAFIIRSAISCIKTINIKYYLCGSFTLSFLIYGVLNSMSDLYLTLIIILVIACNENKFEN